MIKKSPAVWYLSIAITIVAVSVSFLLIVLLVQALRAKQEAEGRQLALEAKAVSGTPELIQQAVLLALESIRLCPNALAYQVLGNANGLLAPVVANYKNCQSPVVFSPDSKAFAFQDGNLARIMRLPDGKEIRHIKWAGGIGALRAQADGTYVPSSPVTMDKSYFLKHGPSYDLGINEFKSEYYPHSACNADETLLAVQSRVNDVGYVDVVNLKMNQKISRLGPIDILERIIISPDSRYVVTLAGADSDPPHEVVVWDSKTGRRLKRFYDTASHDVGAFSKRGDLFALAGTTGTVYVIRVGDWQELMQIHHTGRVEDLAFRADSSMLACITGDGMLTISDILENRHDLDYVSWQVSTYVGKGYQTISASPAGGFFCIYKTNCARNLDFVEGQEVMRVPHDADIDFVVFSPNGKYLATGSADRTVRVSFLNTERAGSLPVKREAIEANEFNFDCRQTGASPLINEPCRRLTRNLTVEEWKRYVPFESYHKTCPEKP